MQEFHETYVNKKKPTVDDWFEYNSELFTRLREGESVAGVRNAPLVDVDRHAEKAGVGVHEYFDELQEKVGPLGRAALHLVSSEMDNAYHVVVVGPGETVEK